MGSVRLYGSTSGYLELQAPAVAPDAVLTLPSDSVQPGLVHLHTETVTAQTVVSIDNCFTSDYHNYKIFCRADSFASADRLEIRLRGGGSDVTSNYAGRELYITAGNAVNGAGGNTGQFRVMLDYSTNPQTIFGELNSPARPTLTSAHLSGQVADTYRSGLYTNTNATAYDGLSVYGELGATWSGFVSIYGYRNN